jgi:hypothetical protein
MKRIPLTDFQLKIVNQWLSMAPNAEEPILKKYNSFLVEELPAVEFDNITADLQEFVNRSVSKAFL